MQPERSPLLAQAAGPLLPWLLDEGVTEIRCTSSGACFVVRFGQSKTRVDDIAAADLDSFLAVLASHVGSEWRDSAPRLHAADPKLGFRVQAGRPPISDGPWMVVCFRQACLTSHFVSITSDTSSQPMYSLWTAVATTMFQQLKALK